MSKLRLKFIQAWVDRDGRAHHYFRRPGFPRLRLPGIVGSEEFMRAYQQALAAAPVAIGASRRSGPGSVSAAIAGYYQSQAFRALKGGSPAMRRAILERFREAHGDKSIALLPRKFVVVLLDTMEPFAARNWLKPIRALMKHCTEHSLIKEDPTQGVRLPPVKSDGHHTWSDDEIAAYEAAHPVGTKARLAFALLLYTAQRRGDVIRMGPQHVHNGELRVVQKKTRKSLILPIRSELQAVLDATPTGHLTFLSPRAASRIPPTISANSFGCGATPPVCRPLASYMACAKPRAVAWRKLVTASLKLRRGAAIARSAKSSATPMASIRPGSRAMRYSENRTGRDCQTRANFDSFEGLSLTTRYRKFLRDEPDQVRWVGSTPLSPTAHPTDTPLRLQAQT